MGIRSSAALLPGSTHRLLPPSAPTNPLPGPRSLPGSRAEMCAGILHRASDGEENIGWSHLSHKGNVEVSFLPSVDFFRWLGRD